MFVSVIYPCSKIFSNCNVFGLLIFKAKIYELFRCMFSLMMRYVYIQRSEIKSGY